MPAGAKWNRGTAGVGERPGTPRGSSFFDLESAVDRRRQAPERALGGLSGLVVIDEIQRDPAHPAAVSCADQA